MVELAKQYAPQETEEKWYAVWEGKGYFKGRVDPAKKPFTIVIPPPNVTGILHMGHALNNTIQDILIRYHRMNGFEALWMPGTDHAGIATQNVVEKALAKEGKRRHDLGREKFVERVWQWKEQYGSTIIRQLKKLGASCDWSRTRFTMDEEYSRAVRHVFVHLWNKKLIYQGERIINWCPRCQTALADEEAPHQDLQGHLYYLQYPLKGDPATKVTVATTRPETMLGDTAVAVNPKDTRFKKLVGKTLLLPLANREIPVIADEGVDMEFGTGAVKITPAHDPHDYVTGTAHKLPFVNVMHPDARMNEKAGAYAGMDRFAARKKIIEDLTQQGLVEKIEPHALSAGHCYRCHTIIEPYLSKQWFVKMGPLAAPALEAVKKGKITFHPARWTKVYLNWMENIQDWCISRQIWWGHRIPVWYCNACGEATAAVEAPGQCPKCKSADLRQEEDVLDTWFSSWLWPFATLYWPNKGTSPAGTDIAADLKYFYPTAALVTAPEIIFFWVARMIMAGYEFMGDQPFKDVYIHGTVRDIEGKKMSKSLGNVIDPLDIIKEYGTDALRFSLIAITAQGQDVFLSKERFEQGRNFANKIWNASRFVMMNLDPGAASHDLCVFFKKEKLDPVNRWILSRFYSTLQEVNKDLAAYKFNEAANACYAFFWHEFCDWYLESIKSDIKNPHTQVVMYKVLEKFLRLLHPYMPFITEEIWQTLRSHCGETAEASLMTQPWPHVQEQIVDPAVEERMAKVFACVAALRTMRADMDIPPAEKVEAALFVPDDAARAALEPLRGIVQDLARVSPLELGTRYEKRPKEFVSVLGDTHLVLKLGGVDMETQKAKIDKKRRSCATEITAKEAMLANENFVKRAPSEIVEKERLKLKELQDTLRKLEAVYNGLQ